jgi:BA14K-like protein
MTNLKSLNTVIILLAAMTATPVFAQAAISEPGAFAFYHPDRDVLNGGAPIDSGPGGGAFRPMPPAGSDAYAAMDRVAPGASSCARRYRSYDPASGTFLGYDGRRHACD